MSNDLRGRMGLFARLLPLLLGEWLSRRAMANDVDPHPLDVGIAGHAFDHLGGLADQAPAAAASGASVIYTTGFGWMYQGMRPPRQMKEAADEIAAYVRRARAGGIRLAFGYVCATSIVDLAQFDRNWPPDFRARFASGPGGWLQQDREGRPLPSWYGGAYHPACMNNPDWRAYEKYVVRLQLEAGMDGIFFDNPTVHPQGCYCAHCMKKFAAFLDARGVKAGLGRDAPAAEWRKVVAARSEDFLRFRATIAADFLAEVRAYARTIKPGALVTCNNSLNAPDTLFRQCRTYGYNIPALSEVEDLVVVEDMVSQPRVLPSGAAIEYGPAYEVLRAISHGKPVVAIALAEGDYHTPPDLTRLAMAEAAAHGASYLMWPTWPQEQRQRMIAAARPEADLLRQNAGLLSGARGRADVALFLPFDEWVTTADCRSMQLAGAMAAVNVQFQVVGPDELQGALLDARGTRVLLLESPLALPEFGKPVVEKFRAAGGSVLYADRPDWLAGLQKTVARPSVSVTAPRGAGTVRAVVRDQPGRTVVHLLNLNVRRVSSFEDTVTPATQLQIDVCVPRGPVHSVRAITADPEATGGPLVHADTPDGPGTSVRIELPRLVLSTMIVIE